ncbi:hypothetical protein CVT26_009842 [Gymnopilus dilepis]|uniref:Protein kinase domain-containing protein n=1 Tax=Gymnopilus dilepis TaxID=231916 RepID=A0A409WCN7_9AGAR|nr:hypothetical protein CVT26_009842 [Gymnopilus dilepis]
MRNSYFPNLESHSREGEISTLGVCIHDTVETKSAVYTITTPIGSGASGEVWRARTAQAGENSAVKILRQSTGGVTARKMQVIAHLIHSYVPEGARYFSLACAFGTLRGHDCIISQLQPMDLRTLLEDEDICPLPLEQQKSVTWQILTGLRYLHKLGIAHTDIKPSNILVESTMTTDATPPKVGGSSKHNSDPSPSESPISTTVSFPDRHRVISQVHRGIVALKRYTVSPKWSKKADIFAVGCVTYELHKRKALFSSHGKVPSACARGTKQSITGNCEADQKLNLIVDRPTLAFLTKAVNPDPRTRPTAARLLRHSYFGPLADM